MLEIKNQDLKRDFYNNIKMKDSNINKFVSELPQKINDAKLHFNEALTHINENPKYKDE